MNVPGLVSFENGETLHAILNALAVLGYGVDVRILGALYYGDPQTRWRMVIIGLRGKNVLAAIFSEPIYQAPIRPNFTATFNGVSLIKTPTPETDSKFETVYEALSDLPPLKNGEQGESVKEYYREPFCEFLKRARTGSIGVLIMKHRVWQQ